MKVSRLAISNYRGIKSAELHFDGHTLMVGPNNVGKSTICSALELVLSADRLNRRPQIEEFDFYNAEYLGKPSEIDGVQLPIPFRIEVVLTDLTGEVENFCGGHTEFWNAETKKLLESGEAEAANPPVVTCLRLVTTGVYNPDEDEFDAETYFSSSPTAPEGELVRVPTKTKRMFGFLYLRALRTGTRALSLERGSLLDVILRTTGVRTGLWEKTIERLRSLDIGKDAHELEPVLDKIESRLARYVPTDAAGKKVTSLYVSQLTREHLRKTMAFFLTMSNDQAPVPFAQAGTGTLNTLVLALLSLLAELKPDTVIFAMEEPEIAVPPHTQRRIVDYLLNGTTQAFVTSHSPFVIERFDPKHTLLLSRDAGVVSTRLVSEATGLKDNEFKRYARRGLTEAMLGKAALVVEGVTEFFALPVVARRMEERNPNLQPLDIAGVTLFDADGDGNAIKFGTFFKTLGLQIFSFFDTNPKQTQAQRAACQALFDINGQHAYPRFEDLIVAEVPVDRLWSFLEALKASGENGNVGIPAARPANADIQKIAKQALASNKGAGWGARLLELCIYEELPKTIVDFLQLIYDKYPPPEAGSAAAAAPPPPIPSTPAAQEA